MPFRGYEMNGSSRLERTFEVYLSGIARRQELGRQQLGNSGRLRPVTGHHKLRRNEWLGRSLFAISGRQFGLRWNV